MTNGITKILMVVLPFGHPAVLKNSFLFFLVSKKYFHTTKLYIPEHESTMGYNFTIYIQTCKSSVTLHDPTCSTGYGGEVMGQ
jgi:hypothetical protein